MRTIRRSTLTTAAALTLILTATTLSAATRDTTPAPAQPERASIAVKVKRVLDRFLRAFETPTVPIPVAPTTP
jgi:hypothetical protein